MATIMTQTTTPLISQQAALMSDVKTSKINLCKTITPGSTEEANYLKQMSK